MRNIVRHYKLIKWLLWLMILTQLGSAAIAFISLRRTCARTGTPLSSTWGIEWIRDLDVNATYPGARILTTGLAQDVLLHLVFALTSVAIYFCFRVLNRRNIALLHYMDRDAKDGAGRVVPGN